MRVSGEALMVTAAATGKLQQDAAVPAMLTFEGGLPA
jgi:hypothetical protein